MNSTITHVRPWDEAVTLPVFWCSECGDLFIFAVVKGKDSSRNQFEDLHLIASADDQKPRVCPMCGAKNKVTS